MNTNEDSQKDNLIKLDEISDINQKITFCSELLNQQLSSNSDPKIAELLQILENASVRLTDYVIELRDKLDS